MKKILVIGLGILILCAGILLVFFLETLKQAPPQPEDTPTPTNTPQGQEANTNPPIDYDNQSTETLLRTVTNRPTPSSTDDSRIRQLLITGLNGTSGVISETATYTLEYSQAPDSFSSEIKTMNINQAKLETINYLKSRGLSEEGICKLPLFFYLNYKISQEYSNSGQTFSPIPDFC